MFNYQVRIFPQWFRFKAALLQAGWAQATIGDSGLAIAGKSAPGTFALLFVGALIAQWLAKPKTVTLAYKDITDVSLKGNKVTIKFKGEKGKEDKLILAPFKEKGFFGGKGKLGEEFVAKLQEKSAA